MVKFFRESPNRNTSRMQAVLLLGHDALRLRLDLCHDSFCPPKIGPSKLWRCFCCASVVGILTFSEG